MRTLYKIIPVVLLSFVFWSCSEDVMDKINKDVNDPTQVESRLIITDTQTSTAFSVIGSDLAFYSSVYVELNTGIYGQMYTAEIRSGDPISATTYDNNWVTIYNNLYNLKVIRDKCSDGGPEAGNYHTLGIAEILTALNLATLTDLFGDVPWTEALQPGVIFTPKIDKQQDIYTVIFNFLDDAIANLDKESVFPSLGDQDFIYGGDTGLWTKLAYGLKARYTMRLSLRTPNYNNVISFANQSFASASEQALYKYNGSSTFSPFYRFYTDRDYFGASKSLHDKLLARNDPRDTIFWKLHPGTSGSILFAPNGSPVQAQSKYSISALSDPVAPTYLFSYHELEFLKAEAYVRLNQLPDAQNALKLAIEAAFVKLNKGLTVADADNYFTNEVLPLFNANPLSEVMNQKYIAFYEVESVEAYNDYRRLKAMGNNVINLENPLDAIKFPFRFTYGGSDVTTNANVRAAYGDGTYVYNENVWWAGGTR